MYVKHDLSDKAWTELGFVDAPEDADVNYRDFAKIVVKEMGLADWIDERWIETRFNDDDFKDELDEALRAWVVAGHSPGAIRLNRYMRAIFEKAVTAVMEAGGYVDLDEGSKEPITEKDVGLMRFYRKDGSSVAAHYGFDSEKLWIEVMTGD